MKVYPYVLIAVSTLGAMPVSAQSDGAMKGMRGMNHPMVAEKSGQGVGVIIAIDQKAGKVTIKHGPILAVNWPAMTMTFKATPPALLKGFRVGQTVAFNVKTKGMDAEVTALRPR